MALWEGSLQRCWGEGQGQANTQNCFPVIYWEKNFTQKNTNTNKMKNSYNLQHPHPPITRLLVHPLDILNRQNTEFSYQYNILDNDQTSILLLIVITSFC